MRGTLIPCVNVIFNLLAKVEYRWAVIVTRILGGSNRGNEVNAKDHVTALEKF